jgi:hypothetical protein
VDFCVRADPRRVKCESPAGSRALVSMSELIVYGVSRGWDPSQGFWGVPGLSGAQDETGFRVLLEERADRIVP